MSSENVEAFRRGIDAVNRGDIEALLSMADPDIELYGAMAVLLGGDSTVYRGHDGVVAWLRDLDESFAEIHFAYPDVRDLGARLLAFGRARARGKASGANVESPVACVAEFRDGRATYIRAYVDADEAAKAAGAQAD